MMGFAVAGFALVVVLYGVRSWARSRSTYGLLRFSRKATRL